MCECIGIVSDYQKCKEPRGLLVYSFHFIDEETETVREKQNKLSQVSQCVGVRAG